MRKSVIIGVEIQDYVACSYLMEANIDIVGFIDDSTQTIGNKVIGVPVLGCYIGRSIFVLSGNIIMSHTEIGSFFMMNTCITIAHHVLVNEGVSLS